MAQAAPVRALPAGTELQGGKFATGRMLGEGGFGITYKGAHKPLQRTVALKELFPAGAVRDGTRVGVSADRQDDFRQEQENILQEARLIARLNSPHIMAVYDVFQENGTVYIVMEYLEGQTLQAEIDRLGQLVPDRVQEIGLDACKALAVLHNGNLLHRDVKPANIMLTTDGRTVLIDFGSAREYVIHQTAQHTRILTEDYAAPEQYSEEARFGPYTDIFCLGGTLFHALRGGPCLSAMDRLLSDNPAVSLPSGLPGPLCDAIQQALQLKVQDRPQDIGTFRNALSGPSSPPPAAPRASSTTCAYCGTDHQDGLGACPSCGMAQAAPVRALPVGTELQGGTFAIGRMLGEGGFGITYKGAHKPLQRTVALKELFPAGAWRVGPRVWVSADRQDEFRQEQEGILQEARQIASLNSPHNVAVHDVFQENGTVYIVMEFLEGKTLQAEIDRLGQLVPDRVQEIALDTCKALAVLHSGNLLHRDVKPANIMLTADSRTVLIDFGPAREYEIHQTAQHSRILTDDYAAPEQYSDQARFGPYTDIFCLGATLFHALTGTPPARALVRLQSSKPAVSFPPGLPGPLCDAIQQALQLKVQDRPQDIGTFRNALSDSSSPPPAAPQASPTSQPVTSPLVGSGLMRKATNALAHVVAWIPSVGSELMRKATKSAGRLSPRGLLLATFSVVLLSTVSATAASGVVPFRSIASALVPPSLLPTPVPTATLKPITVVPTLTPTPVTPKPTPTATPVPTAIPQSQSVVPTAVPIAKPGSAPVVNYTTQLRSGPGIYYSDLSTISRDSQVRVIAKNGSWLYLQIGNYYGWVFAAAIANAPPKLPFRNKPALTPTATTPKSTPVPRSHANRLSNLRSGPSIQYDIVGGLEKGEQVKPVARNQAGDWLKLDSGAWIFAELVENISPGLPVETNLPAPPPTPLLPAAVSATFTPVPVEGDWSNPIARNKDFQSRDGLEIRIHDVIYEDDLQMQTYIERRGGQNCTGCLAIELEIANRKGNSKEYVAMEDFKLLKGSPGAEPYPQVRCQHPSALRSMANPGNLRGLVKNVGGKDERVVCFEGVAELSLNVKLAYSPVFLYEEENPPTPTPEGSLHRSHEPKEREQPFRSGWSVFFNLLGE